MRQEMGNDCTAGLKSGMVVDLVHSKLSRKSQEFVSFL